MRQGPVYPRDSRHHENADEDQGRRECGIERHTLTVVEPSADELKERIEEDGAAEHQARDRRR